MDGYEIVSNYFKEWIEPQTYIDRFYVAIFEARRNNLTGYTFFTELFELDQDWEIVWQIDWCEGESDIVNIRFYSFKDLVYMALNYEDDYIPKSGWYNRKRVR